MTSSTATATVSPVRFPLWRALNVQRRVVVALMLRQLVTRFGRHNLGGLWLVVEPMFFTLGVTAVWNAMSLHRASAIPIVSFAVTGYSAVLTWRNTVSHCNGAIESNLPLMFHRNVRAVDVILSTALLEICAAGSSFLILTFVFVAIGWIPAPHDPLHVILGWLMMAWFALGLGLTVGAATVFSPVIERIWHPIAYLLFPLSGAAYMADWLPPGMRNLLLVLPMVHALEFIREGYFANHLHFHYDMQYMALCNLGLTLSGLLMVRAAGHKLEGG